jgi:hypothetical protein
MLAKNGQLLVYFLVFKENIRQSPFWGTPQYKTLKAARLDSF